jgi:hypothetical protein
MRRIALLFAAVLLLTAPARRRAVEAPSNPQILNIDVARSLVITDPSVLSGITLERVLQSLIDRAGVNMTPLQLYRQWFDTQNPKPGLAVADAPHCDDVVTNGNTTFNGYMRRCPTPEGVLATTDPFGGHEYAAAGIANRFDQTPADGSNCGQYRIVFSRLTGTVGTTGVQIIFEGVLPNPNPAAGIAACRPVAQFLADLSGIASANERRTRIEQFFFDGIPGFAPLIKAEHFTNGGRVRNKHVTFVPQPAARFYQFVIEKRCSNDACRLLMVPDVVENAPYPSLYNASLDTPFGAQFRDEFIRQIPTLAIKDINYYVNFPKQYLVGETSPPDSSQFGNAPPFVTSLTSAAGQSFEARIQQELTRIGSTLTPREVVLRADTQDCFGCHNLGADAGDGIHFPASLLNTHITISAISPALRDVFAPNRARVLHDFLAFGTPPPVHVN